MKHPAYRRDPPLKTQRNGDGTMANFTTHIAAGTLVAGALGTLTLAADVVAPENVIAVTLAGVVGSVLPDIDLQKSRAGRGMFAGLAVFFSFAVLFTYATKYSIAELWILWLGALIGVRYGLYFLFHKLSVHRGNWHSLMAGLLVAALTAIAFKYVFNRHEGVAWLGAGFMFIGYFVHLVLDEMYSVDITGRRLKASFGTALKFFDNRYPSAAIAMAAATAIALVLTPSPKTFVDGMSSKQMWTELNERMWPQETWFGIFPSKRHMVAGPNPSDAAQPGLETGSINSQQ